MDKPTGTESADSPGESGDHVQTGNGGPRDVPIEEDSDSNSSHIADEEAGGTEHPEDQEEDVDDTYDDGDDDDDDDDEEPTLKYERVGGAIPDLLKKDTASALAVSSTLLVMIPVLHGCPLNMLTLAAIDSGYTRWHCSHSRYVRRTHKVIQTPSSLCDGHRYGRNGRFCGHSISRW